MKLLRLHFLALALLAALATAGAMRVEEERDDDAEGSSSSPLLLLPGQSARDLRRFAITGGSGGGSGRWSGKADKSGKQSKEEPPANGSGGVGYWGGGGWGHPQPKSGKKSRGRGGSSSSSHDGNDRDDYGYYLAPFGCANMCVDADGANFRTGRLDDAVQSCSTGNRMHGVTQLWSLHETNDMFRVESRAYRGKCIGVNYMPGDSQQRVEGMCDDGVLALLPCDDPGAMWYFTGGQLISFFCWTKGVSSTMGVSIDDNSGKCEGELKAQGSDSSMAVTFMFVESEVMRALYDPPPAPKDPTMSPTGSPTSPTTSPSYSPTLEPTLESTLEPTLEPSLEPSVEPSVN